MAFEKYPLDKLLKEHCPIQYPGLFSPVDAMFVLRPIVSNYEKRKGIEYIGLIHYDRVGSMYDLFTEAEMVMLGILPDDDDDQAQ